MLKSTRLIFQTSAEEKGAESESNFTQNPLIKSGRQESTKPFTNFSTIQAITKNQKAPIKTGTFFTFPLVTSKKHQMFAAFQKFLIRSSTQWIRFKLFSATKYPRNKNSSQFSFCVKASSTKVFSAGLGDKHFIYKRTLPERGLPLFVPVKWQWNWTLFYKDLQTKFAIKNLKSKYQTSLATWAVTKISG